MTNEQNVLEVVRRTILDVVPDLSPEDIRPELSLADLGCNSLDRADIITLTMADLGLTIPLEEFRPGVDLAGLARQLAAHT